MKSIVVIGLLFAGVAAVLAADPLQQVPSGQAQFRAAVDLVQLDVSVLDRDRRPVRGLTAADFTILENGRARGRVGRSQPERPYVPRFSRARARFCCALAEVGSSARAR